MTTDSASEAGTDDAAKETPWQGAFRELVRGFFVLRDLFSYALPGAAFLAIGLWSRQPGPSQLITKIEGSPAWAVMLLGLFASYLIGHCLLAAFYLVHNVGQILQWLRLLWTKLTRREVKDSIHRLSVEEAMYRRRAPELFVELDRHRIISNLRRGLALALVLGVIVFRWWPDHWWDGSIERLLVAGGVVIWISVLSGALRGRQITADTLQAAREVLRKSEPVAVGADPKPGSDLTGS
jgi:hypothetical protein